MRQVSVRNFAEWRRAARALLAAAVPPRDVLWSTGVQAELFGGSEDACRGAEARPLIPSAFFKIAEAAACFDDEEKWPLLYRIAFRLVNEQRELLEIESDADVALAKRMEKAVNRDVHKFHAFVRFRSVEDDGAGEFFVAWHEPHHFTVERATPFFARRFGGMRFSILTPKGCAHWDLKELTFSAPATRSMAPASDDTEADWLLYYRSIYNPFRPHVNAMKRELPVRHWPTLPEAALIPELIRNAKG